MANEITSASFDAALAGSKPFMVDFWASWCGPCRAMSPIVDAVATEMADQLDVYKCNVDDEGELAKAYDIVSIPTLILFKGGKPVHTMVGAMGKDALVSELKAHL